MMKGIDVSYAQSKPDWEKVKQTGEVDFVYVKSSEGIATKGPDTSFAHNWSELKRLKIPRGAYHFYRAGHDPVKQAEAFFAIVGKLDPNDMPPVLDVEVPPIEGQTGAQYAENVKKFIEKAEELFERRVVVYTGGPIFNSSTRGAADEVLNYISDRDLWLAAYVVNPDKFVPNAWSRRGKTWTLWQKSGDIGPNNSPGRRFSGIKGVVDYNEFQASVNDLSDWIKKSLLASPPSLPSVVIPPPEPTPTSPIKPSKVEEEVTIDVIVEPSPEPIVPRKMNWLEIIWGYLRTFISIFLRSKR